MSDAPPAGWVTTASAAQALTAGGDKIDASNVSRYLARFEAIPQMRSGKYRYVDLEGLKAHRAENVLVLEKRTARDLPEVPPPAEAVEDRAPRAREPSLMQDTALELKRLELRAAQMDMAEREGQLVAADEVLALMAGVLETFIGELERQETLIGNLHGREIAAAIRRSRKAAQGAAAAKLTELALKTMHPDLAAKLTGTATAATAA